MSCGVESLPPNIYFLFFQQNDCTPPKRSKLLEYNG